MSIRLTLQRCRHTTWRITCSHHKRATDCVAISMANIGPSHPRMALRHPSPVIIGCRYYAERENKIAILRTRQCAAIVIPEYCRHLISQ